jgi:short-subunit dehydrogenase
VKRNIAHSRILVTGASSGIGRALAELAARRGARVMLVARSAKTLIQLAHSLVGEGCDAVAHCGDVTNEQDRCAMFNAAVKHFGGLDILVNNAGILATGHFSEASTDRLRQIMETNFYAAAELMRLAIPLLRESECPTVVNIASITGRRAVPARSEYSASKFALIGLSEAVRAELDKDGINVLVVNPCFVNTQLEHNTLESKARREWHDKKFISPHFVAERTLKAILQRRHEVTIGANGRLLLLVNRLFPRLVDRLMARYVKRLYRESKTASGCDLGPSAERVRHAAAGNP